MPDPDLAAIRARTDAATPGPWDHETADFRDNRSHCARTADADDWNGVVAHTGYGFEGSRAEADAEFIAHARTDVPALLAALDTAQRWKSEALIVLSGWESVWRELGEPGPLGAVKWEAARAEIARLTERISGPRAHPGDDHNMEGVGTP